MTCGWCGGVGAYIDLPHTRICGPCYRRCHYHPAVCPGCGQPRPLAWLDAVGRTVCAGCAGEPSIFACAQCGREDYPYGHVRCARCVLGERLTALLTDPSTGEVHEQLRPLFDIMMSGERPQTAIYWLMRGKRIGPGLLAAMTRGDMPISHEAFHGLPMDRSHNYVRDLLVAVGVLPPYEPLIDRMIPWLRALVEPLDSHHARIVDRFARWKVLRRLRRQAEADQLTKGVVQNARSRLVRIAALLSWLQARGRSIETATQSELEEYLTTQPKSAASELSQFLTWSRQRGLHATLTVTCRAKSEPQVTMSDADRWRHVNTLLHDDSIRLYTRIGGLFTLLFAQPLTDICRMRTDQIEVRDGGRVFVTFQTTPIEMPAPLGALIRTHMRRRGQASYASRDNGWLFPGGIPGRQLATENIRGQLAAGGIRPHSARHAALFALSAQVPHMILAQTLGISKNAATKWAALAARDWSAYVSQRQEQISQ